MVQTTFTVNLSADSMYIDLASMPATILQTFFIQIQNQSLQTLYFKLDTTNLSPWSMSTPATGKLGTINVGTTGWYQAIIQRTNPTVDTTDIGTMRIYVYTDSGYSTQVDYADLNVTVYLENTESFTDVTIQPFANGNAYGWTGGQGLTNEISVEGGGYSYEGSRTAGVGTPSACTRNSTALPNDTKVRMTFYAVMRDSSAFTGYTGYWWELYVTVNGTTVFDTGSQTSVAIASSANTTNPIYSAPWTKFTIDLSAYAGQTVNIVINSILSNTTSATMSVIIDRVVFAGQS